MHDIFPRALLACIVEARPPTARELACMTAKIRREAFGADTVERDDRAALIARAALGATEPAASMTRSYISAPGRTPVTRLF